MRTRDCLSGSGGELAGLVCEVLAVAGGAAALADGLGHVRVQLGDQAGVAGDGDAARFGGQLADDMHDEPPSLVTVGQQAGMVLLNDGQQGGSAMSVDAPREKTFLLARPEARPLEAIAARLRLFVWPGRLTALALAAAVAFA